MAAGIRNGNAAGARVSKPGSLFLLFLLLLIYCRLITLCEPDACGGFRKNALRVGSKSCLHEFTELNFLSVGSQLPPRT